MLNIGKLRIGGENYYLHSVARGVEDYYLGSGEAPGYWLASGARELGLGGEVGDDELRNVLRGKGPDAVPVLGKTGKVERVPGFDLTFLAPKSVALLHELGSAETRSEVGSSHEAAVAAALGYLEEQASGARRGKGGRRSIASKGFIAAAFRHRTSRAGDPLLHTHVLVANLIQGEDGKWGALDAKHLYRHAKTAGYLYQAQLRAEMTKRLGVEWEEVRKGAADVRGIPAEAIKGFSKRRSEVTEVLAEVAHASGRQREVAAMTTRKAKDYSVSPQKLLPEWTAAAANLGLDQEVLESCLGRSKTRRETFEKSWDPAKVGLKLASPEGLTAQASSFTRREVLQAFCAELPAGASVAEVARLADGFLESDLVVPLFARSEGATAEQSQRVSEGRVASPTDEKRYTTLEMLQVEQRVIESAVARRLDRAGVASETASAAALQRRPSLFPDQRAMIKSLTDSGLGVEVVIGKAGAGKTFALDAARDAWELSGFRVIGCSLSARAAQGLQAGSGIQSYTIASLLGDLDDPTTGRLPNDTVIVVDEAGMVGTRDLDRLLTHAHVAGAKVVLVGDDRQLPEIQAGGAFRGIKNRLPAIELTEVRRQPFGWERETLDLLRQGKATEAITEYLSRGRVKVASSADETRRQLIADWWATVDEAEPGVMIAAHRSDVADLNAHARELLLQDGRLGTEEIEVAGLHFAAGDRVMTLKNNRRLGIFNGTKGVVESFDREKGSLSLVTEGGHTVNLPSHYLENGYLTHAYAITGHKAQGMTTEKAFVLGDETLYREWGYVAMSRGKQNNSLYVVSGVDPDRDQVGGQVAAVDDPLAELTRALQRSHAKDLAIDVYEQEGIRRMSLKELRSEWEKARSLTAEMPPDAHGEDEQLKEDRERLKDVQNRLQGRLDSMTQQQQKSRPSRSGRTQARARRSELAEVSSQLATVGKKLEKIERRAEDLHDAQIKRDAWLLENAPQIKRLETLQRELWWREQQRAIAAEVAMPQYLLNAVGERPESPSERDSWRQSVRAVETHRSRWNIADEESAFGDEARQGTEQLQETVELKKHLEAPERTVRSVDLEVETKDRSLEL